MGNKVQFSLKNVHYAPISTGEDGEITFGTPVHIPGACSLTLTRQGSEVKFNADGVLYYTSHANEGYSGTLTLALIPDHFRKAILKEVEDETDHVLVEYADAEPTPFALLFEIEGDERASRRVLYHCTVGVPGEDADGQTPNTPKTEAMDITASPLADGRTRARTTADTVDEVFNNWFKKVWEPSAGTENALGENALGENALGENAMAQSMGSDALEVRTAPQGAQGATEPRRPGEGV